MSAIIIEHLQSAFKENDDIGIAYIYCTYQAKKEEQKTEKLVLSLLKQLIQAQAEIPPDILAIYRGLSKKGRGPSLDQGIAMLKLAIKHMSKVYIILDALDEYHVSDRSNYTTFLTHVLEIQVAVPFGLLATSRPIAEISSRFSGAHNIEIRAQETDITKYIDTEMSKLLCPLEDDQDLQDEIRKEVLRASDGM
jgi:hypothetical protein